MASQALALLPVHIDVDEPVPLQHDPQEPLHAAETLTRTCFIEAYPADVSQVVNAIRELIREHNA